jgi:hypothetical protein
VEKYRTNRAFTLQCYNHNAITGVSCWQNTDREEVTKEFRNGGVVHFAASSTLEMFPVVVLGGGDTEWVACALGKESMAGAHCNHCQRSKKDFHLGRDKPWMLASITAMSWTFRDEILLGCKTSLYVLYTSSSLGFSDSP